MNIQFDVSIPAAAILILNEYKASTDGYALASFRAESQEDITLVVRCGSAGAKGDPFIEMYTGEFCGDPQVAAKWIQSVQRVHGVQVALQTIFEQAQDEAMHTELNHAALRPRY